MLFLLICGYYYFANAQNRINDSIAANFFALNKINDTIMNGKENLDFEFLEKNSEKTPLPGINNYEYDLNIEQEDHSVLVIGGNFSTGFAEELIPPAPAFYKIQSEYYPNGQLKEKGKTIGERNCVRIGIWQFFDEKGNQIKEVNEDDKFGKFGYNELLAFLHLNKYINIETGENRNKLKLRYDVEKKQWFVYVQGKFYVITNFVIDGETGAVISKEETQGGIR